MAKLKDVLFKKDATAIDTALTRLKATYGGKTTLDQVLKALNSEHVSENEQYTLEENTLDEPSFQDITIASKNDPSVANAVSRVIKSVNKGMNAVSALRSAITDELINDDDKRKKMIKDALKKLVKLTIREEEEIRYPNKIYESVLAGSETILQESDSDYVTIKVKGLSDKIEDYDYSKKNLLAIVAGLKKNGWSNHKKIDQKFGGLTDYWFKNGSWYRLADDSDLDNDSVTLEKVAFDPTS